MPYFDKKKKKWKGVVKRESQRFTHAFQTKTEAKTWEVEKWKELENPKQTEIAMGFMMASNEYLDFCKLRFSSTTYGEKRKLCRDLRKRWGDIVVTDITPVMVMKHLEDRARKISDNA
jgi:hypothetical protein